MLKVFKQAEPIPTGIWVRATDARGRMRSEELHLANLVYVGKARDWAEAKRLTPAPLVQEDKPVKRTNYRSSGQDLPPWDESDYHSGRSRKRGMR